MILLKNFIFNELGVNSFILSDHTNECVIIDPGFNTKSQEVQLTEFISAKNLKPVSVIITHGHFDHIFGLRTIQSLYHCPFLMHKDDLHQVERVEQYAGFFGFTVDPAPGPDHFVVEGDHINFGESFVKVIHVPGHSPGSICFYSEDDHLLICGDVLFNGSIGRTDLPGGNHQLLISGIKQKLMVLPDDTVVWPGHGPKTTIGVEHDTNPFLN